MGLTPWEGERTRMDRVVGPGMSGSMPPALVRSKCSTTSMYVAPMSTAA